MAASLSIAAKNAGLDALLALTNGGSLRLYTGGIPATPDDAASGTLLATLALGSPAFGAAVSGVATANAVTPGIAGNTGVVGYGRLTDSSANGEIDLVAGGSWIFTANNATEVLTTNVAHGLAGNTPVEVFAEAGGTLPSGLAALTVYYAGTPSGSTLQLLDAPGGAVVPFTTDGSGTLRLKLAANAIAIASADGSIAAGVTVSVASMTFRF
jgi:hypothetical protein